MPNAGTAPFLQPASSIQTIEELEAMTSPIKAFITDRCEINPKATISISDLFEAWRKWCQDTGYPYPGNAQSFGKNLRAALPEIEIIRPQKEFTRERCYRGITIAST